MANLLNLDKILPNDRSFQIDNIVYKIPGKLSVKSVLEMTKIGSGLGENPDLLLDLLESIKRIVITDEREKLNSLDKLDIDSLMKLYNFILNDKIDDEDSNDEAKVFDNSKNESGVSQ